MSERNDASPPPVDNPGAPEGPALAEGAPTGAPAAEPAGKSEEAPANAAGDEEPTIGGVLPEINVPRDKGDNESKKSSEPRSKSDVDTKSSEIKQDSPNSNGSDSKSKRTKKPRKAIYMSYSPDAGYLERKFVVETVRQLKENNLSEDLWFDRDENVIDNAMWFSSRLEAVEKCKAAILILSDSFFTCPVSVFESRALLERQRSETKQVRVFLVKFSELRDTCIPRVFSHLLNDMVDLSLPTLSRLSLAEKTSIVIGSIMEDLERYATVLAPPSPLISPDRDYTGEYKRKKICQWTCSDLQEWLFTLGVKEFYRQNVAEQRVDGFLLMALTDQDMIEQLNVDNRAVRKKIMQQVLSTLDKEHRLAGNWHLRARAQRPRPGTVYVIYDPQDVRLAQSLKNQLIKKGVQVYHHQNLGQSKEDFIEMNGGLIASCTHILVLLTDAAATSPFVFQETMFADWLGKKIVTAVFKNVWSSMRPSLKAVLGECPSVDFETQLFGESMDVLQHHIKPLRSVPGVVLEQTYLNKMVNGLRPLRVLVNAQNGFIEWTAEEKEPVIFISYHWDMQTKVGDIRSVLESNDLPCWADISPAMQRRLSSSTLRSISAQSTETPTETLQSQIQRSMSGASVVLCCITPKYIHSDNCIKDLTLAETMHKPIIPVMLRFTPWPPEGASTQVRKMFSRLQPVDLSNDKLYKQNLQVLIERVKRVVDFK